MSYTNTVGNYSSDVQSVFKNTFRLLSLNILFAGLLSGLAMFLNLPIIPWYAVLIVYFITLYFLEKNADNSKGVFFSFLFTGWLGFTTGPIINLYLQMQGGEAIVLQSLLGTGLIFGGLTTYTMITKKDCSSWGSFIGISLLSAFVIGILNILIFKSGILAMLISIAFMIFSGAAIMFYISSMIHGGERNYIRLSTGLFVAIYNLFMSLLSILGMSRN